MEKSIFQLKNYEKAVVKKESWIDRLKMGFLFFLDLIKFFVFFVPNVLRNAILSCFPRPKKNVHGQTALITGAGNGIGREIAIELAKCGCNIVVVDVDSSAAEITRNELREMNVKSEAFTVDVTDAKAIEKLCSDVELKMGPIDILVNNAGLVPAIYIHEGTNQDIEKIIKVNLLSHLYTIRQFLPGMIERKRGHIVAISSISAHYPLPRGVVYTASKCGVYGLMKSLAAELRLFESSAHMKFTTAFPYFVSTRKDLMDEIDLRIPAISPKVAGEQIVDAILREKIEATIPPQLVFLREIINCFSIKNQRLFKDIVLREKESLKCK